MREKKEEVRNEEKSKERETVRVEENQKIEDGKFKYVV